MFKITELSGHVIRLLASRAPQRCNTAEVGTARLLLGSTRNGQAALYMSQKLNARHPDVLLMTIKIYKYQGRISA